MSTKPAIVTLYTPADHMSETDAMRMDVTANGYTIKVLFTPEDLALHIEDCVRIADTWLKRFGDGAATG